MIDHKLVCPDCGSDMELTESPHPYPDGRSRLVYRCVKAPRCRGQHGAHSDGTPLGTPANRQTRLLRRRAHLYFDTFWKMRRLTRTDAYALLSKVMDMPNAHIGSFDACQCQTAIARISALMKRKR